MVHILQSRITASVTELKKDPMGTVAAGQGQAVTILNRNAPAFYCVPAATYEALLERLDDQALNALADSRVDEAVIRVSLDDL